MNIPKTAQKIAEAFHKRGYTNQSVDWKPDGSYSVIVEKDCGCGDEDYDVIEAAARTALQAYRKCKKKGSE